MVIMIVELMTNQMKNNVIKLNIPIVTLIDWLIDRLLLTYTEKWDCVVVIEW